MKNKYRIDGDITYIEVFYKDKRLETVVVTSDLERSQEFCGTWRANWFPDSQTYYVIGCLGHGKYALLHRWLYHDLDTRLRVDHIDHNGLNNRRDNNLRIVTHAQNLQHRKGAAQNSKSGYRNVTWVFHARRWRVRLMVYSKPIHIGYFVCLRKAVKAAEQARDKYYNIGVDFIA